MGTNMTVKPISWEHRLILRAQEGLLLADKYDPLEADSALLAEAYNLCATITQTHSKTFYLASGLLPKAKRAAARALYAFCRITDNLVDDSANADSEAVLALEAWRRLTILPRPPAVASNPNQMVALAWADARARFSIPAGYGLQLIDGVGRDFTQTRYATFADLADYAYGVASTVGLMAMHIIGFSGPEATPYAVKLGVALQLTNILRDVGEDWHKGRLYLPTDELAAYGLDEQAIGQSVQNDKAGGAWRAFMAFQVGRNRQLYAEAMPGIRLLAAEGRFAIAAAANLYEAILGKIETNGYQVFQQRAALSKWGKLGRMPGIWWRSRRP
jgi:15-cis-phytoene synthase